MQRKRGGGYVFKEAVMLETAHARSDEGLTLEMSTLEALYGGLLVAHLHY